jgi:oxygen-independent coproporphyrinogen-3 oxidase
VYQSLEFNAQLIRRYDTAGPRYTSYPTAAQFHSGFTAAEYCRIAEATNRETQRRPLSLYFHIPFCSTVCFYCACSKVVTRDRAKAGPYLAQLYKEIAIQAALFDRDRSVEQLHWGGGTPTFISHEQMHTLMRATAEHFTLKADDSGEYSIEVDPRDLRPDTLSVLRELGFNRLSIGVQDLDERIQKAVNRVQTACDTLAVVQQARRLNFKSVSIDLMYGLPFQTVDSFARTLNLIIAANPDRLSVFNYAHLPDMFKPQRRIKEVDLPSPSVKLDILKMTIEKLAAAGYVYIGMDHFAKPTDELAMAQRYGTLYRNFQGYSTHADCDLVAMGVTAISKVGNSYSQNAKGIEDYYHRLDEGYPPVVRGIELSKDDLVRRDVITRLICHFELDMSDLSRCHGIDFKHYFSPELGDIAVMQDDGLLRVEGDTIRVMPAGRLLIRNICMVFDKYIRYHAAQRFSKVI